MLYLTLTLVQVWDFETIDNADITDENAAFEMDPLTEIRVSQHQGARRHHMISLSLRLVMMSV